MQNENRNEEAVSPVIATILMVAITVVLAGVLYVWASQLAEGNTSGDFSMYDFEVRDASAAPGSENGGDDIVYVSLKNGAGLSWSAVIVQMSADPTGDSPFSECTNPDKPIETGCAVVDNDDGEWAFGEEVVIKEGSDDLCGTGTCKVSVKVLDRSTNKLIYESSQKNV